MILLAYWNSVRPLVSQVLNNQAQATPEIAVEINNGLLGVLQHFDQITGMYENANNDKVQRSMAIIYGCQIGFIAITVFTWYITNR